MAYANLQHNSTVEGIVQDFQRTAEMRRLEFDAAVLFRVYSHQYRTYAAPNLRRRVRESDYVACRMNELLEAMIGHYGSGGGGRYRLHDVRRQEMMNIQNRLRLVKG